MKIKNMKKFIRSILLIIMIAFITILLIQKSTFSHKEIEYKTIYVSEGDTLWTIAKSNQINNKYYKGKDIRYILYDIININSIDNSTIYCNQELLIPIG